MQVHAVRRPLVGVILAAGLLLLATATIATRVASATTLAPETTFGLRDYFKPERTVDRCEAIKGGKLAVAGVFAPQFTSPSRWGGRNRLATAVIGNPSRHTSKTTLRWHRQPVPRSFPIATEFGEDGSFLQLTLRDSSPNPEGRLYEVRKSTRGGRVERRFSGDGRLQLRAPASNYGTTIEAARLLSTVDGGVIVAYFAGNSLHVRRYAADGSTADWGTDGTVTLAAMNPFNSLPPSMRLPLAETPGGGLLVTANIGGRDALVKLDSKGVVDAGFGTAGRWLPPAPDAPASGAKSSSTSIAGVDVAPTGEIAVLYAMQQTYDLATASEFHAAQLEATGTGQILSPALGSYTDGGDTGFPSAYPFDFKLTPAGVVVAFAETFYPNSTVRYNAAKWVPGGSVDSNTLGGGRYFRRIGFGSFAIADSGDRIYACGSYGVERVRGRSAKYAKHLVVRRIRI